MKIAFFSGGMNRSGGTERVLSIIANGLTERGHEVIILSLTGSGATFYALNEKIRVYWIGSKSFQTNILSNLKKLNKILKDERPDFLIDVDIILCFYSILLKITNPKIHWISWEHFNYFTDFNVNKNLRKIARFLVSRFSECLIVLSDEDKGYYQDNMRLKCKIKRLYKPLPYEDDFQKKEEKKTVLAVGRLVRIKGFDMLLKSWKPVEKKHPDWKLRIAGDGEEKEALIEQAKRFGLKNVEFAGLIEDVKPEYKEAAFFVLSSRNEGFCMVLLEAMNFSLPAVAFACKAGVSEVVKDGVNGYLVTPGDIKEYARKLDKMISNETIRHSMGTKAKEMISKFSRDEILNEWERLLEEF